MSDTVWAAVLGAAIAGTFTMIMWWLNRCTAKKERERERTTGTALGVQVLLEDRIKYLAKKYISENEIAPEDLRDLMRMHEVYHDELGGNGYLNSLMAAVKKLRITGGNRE